MDPIMRGCTRKGLQPPDSECDLHNFVSYNVYESCQFALPITQAVNQLQEQLLKIRPAESEDLRALLQLDPTAQREESRATFIRRSLACAVCFVATEAEVIVGYSVLDSSFFDRAYISMLYVHPEFRRRGIGFSLMLRMEEASNDSRLFTSTNQSNTPMQALLNKLGYRRSGFVENLDEGDPELIYVKDLQK
jgi:ribosomal protein S18 acetylase RimI-like enzyme